MCLDSLAQGDLAVEWTGPYLNQLTVNILWECVDGLVALFHLHLFILEKYMAIERG